MFADIKHHNLLHDIQLGSPDTKLDKLCQPNQQTWQSDQLHAHSAHQ